MNNKDFDGIPEESREFIPDFIAETEENLRLLNENLLAVEEAFKRGENFDGSILNALFRAAHSIKGTASFIGVARVVELTHKMETLLQKIRDGELQLSPAVFDVLFTSFDVLVQLIGGIKDRSTKDVDLSPVMQKIDGVLSGFQEAAPSVEKKEQVLESFRKKLTDNMARNCPGDGQKALPLSGPEAACFMEPVMQLSTALQDYRVAQEQDSGVAHLVAPAFAVMKALEKSSSLLLHNMAKKILLIIVDFHQKGRGLDAAAHALLLKGVKAMASVIDSLRTRSSLEEDVFLVCGSLEFYVSQNAAPVAETEVAQRLEQDEVDLFDADALVDLRSLNEAERVNVYSALDQGFDVFRIVCLIAAHIPAKVVKMALIDERLKKNGIVISLRPPDDVVDALEGDVLAGAIFCSIENENNIRKSLSMGGVDIKLVERLDRDELRDILSDVTLKAMSKNRLETEAAFSPQDVEGGNLIQEPVSSGAFPSGGQDLSVLKIDSRKIDKLMVLSGELVTIRSQYNRVGQILKDSILQRSEIESQVKNLNVTVEKLIKKVDGMVPAFLVDKQPGGRDSLKKICSDLNEGILRIKGSFSRDETIESFCVLDDTTSRLEKVSAEIQSNVMQTRMMPMEVVFNRFKRIIRDLARDIGKEVRLQIEGEDTELDKKIIDGLAEPLAHLVRNAVDHGIEPRETRRRAGKNETGTICLRASHLGNNIRIQVRDDGRGIDPELIAQTAVMRKLVAPHQIETMSAREKIDLIFLPGLSTAEKITGLSGRGVGMDSVKEMITAINGVVDIESDPGKGTTFVIRIPLTLAIIQGLLVRVGQTMCVFSLDTVQEIVRLEKEALHQVDGNIIVMLRGHAVSLIHLEQVLQIKGRDRRADKQWHVVIISDGVNRVGVVVDDLISKEDVVIKALPRHFASVQGLAGATLLAGGDVAFILDSQAIIRMVK